MFEHFDIFIIGTISVFDFGRGVATPPICTNDQNRTLFLSGFSKFSSLKYSISSINVHLTSNGLDISRTNP